MRTSQRKQQYPDTTQSTLGDFVPHKEERYITTPKFERLRAKLLARQKKEKS